MMDRLLVICDGLAVTDDTGRIPLFVTTPCAAVFAAEVERRTNGVVCALSCGVDQIAQLLAMHDLDETDVYDFEATTDSAEDALKWAVELAGRCVGYAAASSTPSTSS